MVCVLGLVEMVFEVFIVFFFFFIGRATTGIYTGWLVGGLDGV